MNKQNLWFITLFSIILVLSIYYISMPSNILKEYTNNIDTTSNSDNTEVVVESVSSLTAMRVADDEELLTNISNLQNTITDNTKTIEEKNTAYTELLALNQNKGLEENIESIIKDKFNFDSFAKINKDQVNIVISSSEHNKTLANNIIVETQKLFDTKKYITIKFQ